MKREDIKKVAIEIVTESGLINLSKRNLCARCKIPTGSFNYLINGTFLDLIKELKNELIPTDIHHKVIKIRTDPDLRKDQILNSAIELAYTIGCHRIRRDEVAMMAGVSMGLVTNYFGTMRQLKRAVMRAAIKRKIPNIIAFGIIDNNVYAKKAKGDLRKLALELINGKKV